MATIYTHTPDVDPYIFEIDKRINDLKNQTSSMVRPSELTFEEGSFYHNAYLPFSKDDVHKVYAAYRQCYSPDSASNINIPACDMAKSFELISAHEPFLTNIKLSDIVTPPDGYRYFIISDGTKIDYTDPESIFSLLMMLWTADSNNSLLLKWCDYLRELEFIERHTAHESALEHMQFSIVISSISRACSHQIVRHRISSISQQSQRYTNADNTKYITPPSIKENPQALALYDEFMTVVSEYARDLNALDIPGEDVRFIFPNGYPTALVQTFNVRSLYNFFGHRSCHRAQWEIRAQSDSILRKLRKYIPILFDKAGPGCVRGRCPEGTKTCGISRSSDF